LNTIKKVFNQTGYLLDPHTAVAKDVSNGFISTNKPMILSATAHYSKFAHDVLGALGKTPLSNDPLTLIRELERLGPHPPTHQRLEDAMHKPEIHKNVCRASVQTIKENLEASLRK
jgi:threonine synthase